LKPDPLDLERSRRVNDILGEVLEAPAEGREALLEGRCAGDSSLRAEVETLMRADALAGDSLRPFLDASGMDDIAAATLTNTRLGPYRLVREIAHGGMGAVYLAEREDEFRMRVAIKIVRAGYGDALRRRFQQERQILARLDHPNIAKVLDGGNTAAGDPYLVMEYVDGEPITRYCETRQLSVPARLRLFQSVCSAVQYAHQRLVIHRDLKPANILVTPEGRPKLLDFGIAKLIEEETAGEDHTGTGFRPMTPSYASPEQASGQPVTTSTDIYSLGVILFELACGSRPYRITSTSPLEIQRAILETTPPAPSSLKPTLSPDIDSIVSMAMRKEASRRYSSAGALSEDIRRHLENFPILARSDSLSYRASRFIRRNRVGVIAASLAALALLAGATVALWQAHRAQQDRALAEKRFDDARRFAFSLVLDLDHLEDESATTVRNSLGKRTVEYLDQLAAQVGDDPRLQSELASAYLRLGGFQGELLHASVGDAPAALASYEKGIDLLKKVIASHGSDASLSTTLASAYTMKGLMLAPTDVGASAASHEEALGIMALSARGHPDDPNEQITYSFGVDLAGERYGHPYYANLGDTAKGLAHIEQAVALREKWYSKLRPPFNKAQALFLLPDVYAVRAGMLWATGDLVKAVAEQRRAIAGYEDALGRGGPELDFARAELGLHYVRLANLLDESAMKTEAIESARKSIVTLEPLLEADPKNASCRRNLTRGYIQLASLLTSSAPRDALVLFQKARKLIDEHLGRIRDEPESRERLAEVERGTARASCDLGDLRGAEEASQRDVTIMESLTQLDPRNAHYQFSLAKELQNRGDTLTRKGDHAAASVVLSNALAVAEPLSNADPASWLKRRLVSDLRLVGSE